MKHLTILLLLATAIGATSAPVLSHTRWFKYEGNPVLEVGSRAWESCAAVIVSKDLFFHTTNGV